MSLSSNKEMGQWNFKKKSHDFSQNKYKGKKSEHHEKKYTIKDKEKCPYFMLLSNRFKQSDSQANEFHNID